MSNYTTKDIQFGTLDNDIFVKECKFEVIVENTHTIVKLAGSLNGSNVEEIWKVSKEAFCNPNTLEDQYRYPIYDLSDLEYVSPSGLRMFYELSKIFGNVIAAYATKRVYDIMDTSGLTKVISVLRGAYKIDDIDTLPKYLTEGTTSKIISIDDERILKMFDSTYGDYRIQQAAIYEYQNARNSFILGVPCAMALELVKRNGKYGIIFEKLVSSYYDYLFEDEKKVHERMVEFARFSRDVTKLKVDVKTSGLHDHRDVFFDIERHVSKTFNLQDVVGPKELEKIKKIIFSFPGTHTYLHGDAFFNNVMFDAWGQKKYIDFSYSGYGHPIWEMIDNFIMFSECRAAKYVVNFGPGPYQTIPLNSSERREVWLTYVNEFAGLTDDDSIEELELQISAMIDCINLMTHTFYLDFVEEDKRSEVITAGFSYCMKYINEYYDRGFKPVPFN